MPRRALSLFPIAFCAMAGAFWILSAAAAKDAPSSGTVGGLLIDVLDDGVTVVVDGDEEPTKYVFGSGLDKQSILKRAIFNVNRVNVKYKVDGDKHIVVAIERVVGRRDGVVIGEVLKVYNNFWVAVRPKEGQIDGYALQWPPEKFKQSHDLIKTIKKGDLVAIKYTTDGERHRILQMEVKPAPSK
jgi:hypothetical protein